MVELALGGLAFVTMKVVACVLFESTRAESSIAFVQDLTESVVS